MDAKTDYQHDFSESHRETCYDAEKRAQKARKVAAILGHHAGPGLAQMDAIDVGCSTGIMSHELSQYFGHLTGIDIDSPGIEHARRTYASDKLSFELCDAMDTGLPAASFDVAICAHVYEHVPDSQRLVKEIFRLLKPGGVCFFAAENRLVLVEGDHRLPLLSVMPKSWAHRYLRLAGRGDHYYETHLTYWGLRALVSDFELIDYTESVVRNPEKYHSTDVVKPGSLAQRAALILLQSAYWMFPTYLWLLRRPRG